MITVRTIFSEISFDQYKEYAIYFESYEADRYGRPLSPDSEEVKNGQYYDFGHIIIETETKKYALKCVYEPYQWVAELLDYIDAHREEEHLLLDMSRLMKSGDDFVEFECSDCCVSKI
ncbi:MAG: hypothetical protein J6K51_03365 [Clostridia bacterium]|nr:hypothetical protein [Clostridia bacterium]